MARRSKAKDPYVDVMWMDATHPRGPFFESSFKQSELPVLFESLRKRGVTEVLLDEKEKVLL
jgi:hypothetical protein